MLVFVLLSTFGLRRVPDISQKENSRLIPIYNSQPFIQKISAKNDGLNTINIYLKNARLLNKDPFTFSLSDNKNVEVRRIEISGKNIGDGDNVRFQFLPIPDSAGKEYVLTLQAPYTNFDGDKIEAGVSSDDPGQLAFESFYRPTSLTQILNQSLSGLVIKIINTKYLLVVLGASVFSYLTLFKVLAKSALDN
jgi:hypothetical protein